MHYLRLGSDDWIHFIFAKYSSLLTAKYKLRHTCRSETWMTENVCFFQKPVHLDAHTPL